MFGVGPQELLIIGLLFLVIFGPGKATGMARDLGRFVSGAQNTVEEFKEELFDQEIREAHRTVDRFKSEVKASEEVKEARRSVEELKSGLAPDKCREDDRHRKPQSYASGMSHQALPSTQSVLVLTVALVMAALMALVSAPAFAIGRSPDKSW